MSNEYAPPGPHGSYGEPATKPRNAMAIVALVLGVLALLSSWFFVGLPLAIVGLILSIVGLKRVRRGLATNRGVAITALVVNIVALVAGVVFSALIVAFGSSLWNNGGEDLTNCLNDAGSDQVAAEQCQQNFEDQLEGAFSG